MLKQGEYVTGLIVMQVEFSRCQQKHVPGREFNALTFRHQGRISLTTAETGRLISETGCITFVPKGVGYDTEILENGFMTVVHFTTDGGEGSLQPFVLRPEHETVFRNLFSALQDRFKVGREHDYACMSMLYDILSQTAHERTRHERAAIPPRMRQIREYIDSNFGNSELSVSAMAEQMGVSEVYFRREFRKYFSVSPLQYLKRVRLNNAKALLRAGYDTVGETAAKCGFESLSYFSDEFHRMTGMRPSEYAQEERR